MSPYRKSDAGKTSTRAHGRLRRWGATLRETLSAASCPPAGNVMSAPLEVCLTGGPIIIMLAASTSALLLAKSLDISGAFGVAVVTLLTTLAVFGSIFTSMLIVGVAHVRLARHLAAGESGSVAGAPPSAYAESKPVPPTIATTRATAPSAVNGGATDSVDVPRPNHIPQGLWDSMNVRDRMYIAHIAAQMAMLEKFLQSTIAYRFADFKAKGIPGDELHVLRNICREAGARGLSFGDNPLLRALVDRGLVTAYKATPLGEAVLSAAISGDVRPGGYGFPGVVLWTEP